MENTANNYCHYLRVSTQMQGIDGYGIAAQREAVKKYTPKVEFVEVESGKRKDRPELLKALEYCKKNSATLVVAKFDRLSRNCAFLLNLMESGVEFIAADFPQANKLTITVLGAVAEHEAAMISARTKAGIKAAQARGVEWGRSMDDAKQFLGKVSQVAIADRNALKVKNTITGLLNSGLSLRKVASELNTMNVPTPRGKQWTATAVRNAAMRG